MSEQVTQKRLGELRVAAEVGIRMGGIYPHTVHVNPAELAALVEELHIRRGEPLNEINATEIARLDLRAIRLREALREALEMVRVGHTEERLKVLHDFLDGKRTGL